MPSPSLPTPTTDVPRPAPRPATLHKGQAGHVAIIAGSRGMSGAAVLSALGALRGGAGLTRVYCARSIQPIIAASEPCLMSVPLDEDEEGRLAVRPTDERLDLGWAHAVAIGPGLGQSAQLRDLVTSVIAHFAGPLLVDADGLNNIAPLGDKVWAPRAGRSTVITPHPGEMARLRHGVGLPDLHGDDDDTRLRIAHEYAARTGATVVLKGHRTIVCTPSAAYINTTGNPGMAAGGMGDVLTGFIAALLGQRLSPFDAARLGVYCHGLAADHCRHDVGPGGDQAREVADVLPAALAEASRSPIGFK
jgi:hydroxyethylthiazole kinase-like uncharacterized protein yjeF